jgi:hypothetical protein
VLLPLVVSSIQKKRLVLVVRDPANNPFIDTHLSESIKLGDYDRSPLAVNQ